MQNIEEKQLMQKLNSEEYPVSEQEEGTQNDKSRNQIVFEDVDEVLVKIGGFSKFQFFSFTIIVTGMAAGAFILYNLYYFEKEPTYMCRYNQQSSYKICTSEEICDDANVVESYFIDWTDEGSLHNWVEQLDLKCRSSIAVSFIGSSFFFGAFIGSFILPRASDVYGRRPMFLVGLVLYLIVIIGLVFNTSLYLTYVLLLLGGISETGRYYVAYVYCVEMMPDKYQNLSGLLIFVVFGCLQILFSIYFWFISKEWINLAYMGGALSIISFILTIWKLPESPRFYFSKKRFDEARVVLLHIAKFNGKSDINYFVFESETQYDNKNLLENNGNNEIGQAAGENEFKGSMLSQQTQQKLGINVLKDTTIDFTRDPTAAEPRLSEKQKIIQIELQLKGTLGELFKNKTYLRNLLIMTTIWSFGSFGFFFIPFYLDTLKGNTYLFAIFSGSAELLASLACILVTRCMTLKQSIILFCGISCAASFAIIFAFGSTDILVAVLILFNNFGITSTFDVAYLLNTQMFPTIFLGTAYGFCNIVGRFISIMSPIIAKIVHPYPLIIMVIFSGISATLALLLKRMPDQIDK
ncbi:organic cation [Stylonychia lemnae]|uniref:Organic cation n=1 Tax=Stylonychia lemnae TaxID=5949 RepID=A0A078B2Z9_STYLE|nr:organic cation [Stylonychia lemnae]|eukprot:CDW88844.1 organic cation [Stylonychia lemnae]